jgi:serralysin
MQNWFSQSEPTEKPVASFDGLDYVASYPDLVQAFANAGTMIAVEDAGAQHFIQYGLSEDRQTSSKGLDYIASYNQCCGLRASSS